MYILIYIRIYIYSVRLAMLNAMKLHRPSNVHHLCTIVGPLCGLLLTRL